MIPDHLLRLSSRSQRGEKEFVVTPLFPTKFGENYISTPPNDHDSPVATPSIHLQDPPLRERRSVLRFPHAAAGVSRIRSLASRLQGWVPALFHEHAAVADAQSILQGREERHLVAM